MFSTLRQSRVLRGLGAILWLSIMAGCLTQGQLGDRVWLDLNANGIQDDGEPGVQLVEVVLYLVTADGITGDEVATTITNEEGEFFFDNLEDGQDYQLEFKRPDDPDLNLNFTILDQGDDDEVDSDANPFTGFTEPFTYAGQAILNLDAGLIDLQTASIRGFAWEDADADGIQDAGEDPEEAVLITLFRENPPGSNDFVEVHSTQTGPDGFYNFDNPPPSDYYLEVTPPPGDSDISPVDAGGDDSIDSDFGGLGIPPDETETFTFNPREGDSVYDVGLIPLYEISDWVWEDANSNGVQDDGEEGVPGIAVELWSLDNSRLEDTVITDQDGFYRFEDVRPGEYFVYVDIPLGYEATFQDRGNDDELDSDIHRVSWTTEGIDVSNGDDGRWDAGLVPVPESLDHPHPPGTETFFFLDETGHEENEALDQFVCGTTDQVDDPEGDVLGFRLSILPNGDLWVTVLLRQPLVNDYSWATSLILARSDFSDFRYFLWEIHAGEIRIGELDFFAGGDPYVYFPQEEIAGIWIDHFIDFAVVSFAIPADLVPSPFDLIEVDIFHTGQEGGMTNCDFQIHDVADGVPAPANGTATNGDGDHNGPTESTTTVQGTGDTEGFNIPFTIHQEGNELVVIYQPVDADGESVEGTGRATIAIGSPGGDLAAHGEGQFDEDGKVTVRLSLDKFEEGDVVDVYIFFDGLSNAPKIGTFTVGSK